MNYLKQLVLNFQKLVIFFLLVIAVSQLFPQESIGQITGSVNDADQQPLPQVNVVIKGTEGYTN